MCACVQLPLHINLDNPGGGSHRNFVTQEAVQKEIGGQFKAFLRDHQDANGDPIYYDRLRNMCTSEAPVWTGRPLNTE